MSAPLIIAGFLIGSLVGLTGVGGGSLMTPLLVSMGLNPMVAVGTDMFYSLPTKLLGWFLHRQQGTIDLRITKYLCLGGIPAALAGLAVLQLFVRLANASTVEEWTKHAIGVSVVLAAIVMIVSPFAFRHLQNRPRRKDAAPGVLVAGGAAVGLIVSLTSIGSGSLTLPLLLLCVPGRTLAEMVGSDIAFGAILLLVSVLGRWQMGHVDLAVSMQLLIGSLAGVFLGSRLCGMLQQRWMRPAIAVVLAVAGARLI